MALSSAKVLGVDILTVDTVQQHALGQVVEADDGNTYRYVKAGAAIALGDCLMVDHAEGSNDYHPTAAADEVIVGCWPSGRAAAIADNSFFWAGIRGAFSVKAAVTVAPGAPVVTIATAGTVDDTAATAANALAAAAGIGGVFRTVTAGGFATVVFF